MKVKHFLLELKTPILQRREVWTRSVVQSCTSAFVEFSFICVLSLSFLHTLPRSAVFLHFFSSAVERDGLFQGVLLPWRCLAWYRLGLWSMRHFLSCLFFCFLLPSSPLPGLMGKNKTQIRQEEPTEEGRRALVMVVCGTVHQGRKSGPAFKGTSPRAVGRTDGRGPIRDQRGTGCQHENYHCFVSFSIIETKETRFVPVHVPVLVRQVPVFLSSASPLVVVLCLGVCERHERGEELHCLRLTRPVKHLV